MHVNRKQSFCNDLEFLFFLLLFYSSCRDHLGPPEKTVQRSVQHPNIHIYKNNFLTIMSMYVACCPLVAVSAATTTSHSSSKLTND